MTKPDGYQNQASAGLRNSNRRLPGEWISNSREEEGTASAVKDFLEGEGHVPLHQVSVFANNGQIYLLGDVSWQRRMSEAEEALLEIPGVSHVNNHLRVKPYESAQDLKQRVVAALESRAHRIASRIRIERSHGVVTLRGTVSSNHYRTMAGQVAASAPGVEHVENLIEVGDPA